VAGKGVTKKQAEAKAAALYREHQRDPMAFAEHLGRTRHGTKSVPFSGGEGGARRGTESDACPSPPTSSKR
jgi:hypothetical protein